MGGLQSYCATIYGMTFLVTETHGSRNVVAIACLSLVEIIVDIELIEHSLYVKKYVVGTMLDESD